MNDDFKICICGGGNIAHSLVACFARQFEVTILTRKPGMWSVRISYQIGDELPAETTCKIHATSDASAVSEANLIVVALPRFAIVSELVQILPFLHEGQTLAFAPAPAGLDEIIKGPCAKGVDVVAFQRVPFISRIVEYGKSVRMGEPKTVHRLAVTNPEKMEYWKTLVERFIGGRVEFLSSFLSFTFSNSNPLLHPARLVELLEGGNNGSYAKCPMFYAEWGDLASELYVKADKEMAEVFRAYSPSAFEHDYESALAHYGVVSVRELTEKIRSIPPFKTIAAPWKTCDDRLWRPDFSSRYFTEDVPYGTKIIQQYAQRIGVAVPTIDYFVQRIERSF